MNSRYFYCLLLIIVLISLIINNSFKRESIYNKNDQTFLMEVKKFNIDDNNVSLELNGREDLVGTYYVKNETELEYLKNELRFGDLVYLEGSLDIPATNTVPKAFSYRDYLKHKGINYSLKVSNLEVREHNNSFIYRFKNFIYKRISKYDYKGYLKAFILGDKSSLDDDAYHHYQGLGIAHLFALSGMHVGLISGLLYRLFRKWKSILKDVIINGLLIVYGFIVLFPFSILRCILFFTLNSFNRIFNLGLKSIQVLIIVFCIICLFNNQSIFDVGFWYSFCTVGGILLCESFIKDDNKIKQVFKISLIAFLFSLPITLYSFYEINVLSVFFNVLFIPLVSVIIYPLSLLTFCFPFLQRLLIMMVDVFEFLTAHLTSMQIFSIYMSFNFVEVIIWYFVLLIMFNFKKNQVGIILVFIIVIDLLIPYFDSSSYINFLDVKQGDATLVISSNRKKVILIDTGGLANSNYKVSDNYISYMKSLGIRRVDYLILTHGDYDHMGDALNVINNFNIGKVIFNCGPFNEIELDLISTLNKRKIAYNSCVKEIDIDSTKLQFLHTKIFDNENDNSNVIYTKVNGYKFLFMGDASITSEKEILKKYNLESIDVLKVGHHGSRTSSSKLFLSKTQPDYSIISVGKNNRYDHPNKEVLDNLNDSKIYRTDNVGSIMFKIKNNEILVETCS